jgi:hypothetical protein
MKLSGAVSIVIFALFFWAPLAPQSPPQTAEGTRAIVLHAARLLDVESGNIILRGEVLIKGDVISDLGEKVARPSGAEIIDLGDSTLLPGLSTHTFTCFCTLAPKIFKPFRNPYHSAPLWLRSLLVMTSWRVNRRARHGHGVCRPR